MRNSALFTILVICGVVISLVLGGCSTPEHLSGTGVIAPTPIGYTIACLKNPSLEFCKDN
jgi:hypothetical protein